MTAQADAHKKFTWVDNFFEITKRGSTPGREIRGGIVTFFAMAYIVILNPLILGGEANTDINGNFLDSAAVGAGTSLAAGAMSIIFGIIARLPFAFAAGLGLNSFLAVNVVSQVTWQEAMGIVIINGLIICALSASGIRLAIFRAVPADLKSAVTVGIGFFIAFIGFVNAGFITAAPAGSPVQLGDGGSITAVPTVLFIFTLVLVGVLVARKITGAIFIGLVIATVLAIIVQHFLKLGSAATEPNGWHMAIPELPAQVITLPDFSLLGQFDILGSFSRIGVISAVMLIFTLVFTNFFDALGTMNGLSKSANLQDKNGEFKRIRSAFLVEGFGAVAGGATSSSSTTVFVESASGIAEGARTGLAAITTGVLLLLSAFLTPLTASVPIEVGSAALVIVGALMMAQVRDIDFSDFFIALPAFLTIATMPLSYSIANGIGVGFISYALLHLFAGRAKQVHWIMWIVAFGFAIYFVRGPLQILIG